MLFIPRAYGILDKLERGEMFTSDLLAAANILSKIGKTELSDRMLDWASLSSVLWELTDNSADE